MQEMLAFPNSFPPVKQIKKKWEKEHFHTAGKGFWGVLNGKCQNRKCNCFSFPFLFFLIQDEIFHFDYLHHRMKGLCQNCHFHMKKFQVLKITFFRWEFLLTEAAGPALTWCWTATNSCPWLTWRSQGGSTGQPHQLCSPAGAASQRRFSLSPMSWRDQLALGGCQAMSGGNVALQHFDGGCRQGKGVGQGKTCGPKTCPSSGTPRGNGQATLDVPDVLSILCPQTTSFERGPYLKTPWRQLITEFLTDLYFWNVRRCADVFGFDAFICFSHGAVRDEGQICGFLPRSLCPSPACTCAGSRAVSSSPCCMGSNISGRARAGREVLGQTLQPHLQWEDWHPCMVPSSAAPTLSAGEVLWEGPSVLCMGTAVQCSSRNASCVWGSEGELWWWQQDAPVCFHWKDLFSLQGF